MKRPALSLLVNSAAELRATLACVDITVPHVTEGRSSQHREQYLAARFFATFADTELLHYPLSIQHRDKPDFSVLAGDRSIGIECVEAVPEEWYEIQAIRERHFPDELNFGQIFHPGQRVFSKKEKLAIASGEKKGPPWAGDMAERSWAKAMEHFIRLKTSKLRSGNYSEFTEMWLLVQDEWRAPVFYPQELQLAVDLVEEQLAPLFVAPAYSHIFVCRNSTVVTFSPEGVSFAPIVDLWR
jgi:hypothetical protein